MKERLLTISDFALQSFTILCVLALLTQLIVRLVLLTQYDPSSLLEAIGSLCAALGNIPIAL
jgi:hypothetical protein